MTLTYNQAMAYLESFIHNREEPSVGPHAGEGRFELAKQLMAALGDPQQGFPTIHVGGTAGKGSTSTFIASILQAAGYRTGLHTSPYVQSPEEKTLINGELISQADFARLMTEIRNVLEQPDSTVDPSLLTYVPVGTALTFRHFAQQRIDYGVIEVSLGGRYDPTNVVQPEVAIVTNVGYDHMNVLGHTLPEIAWHKAGIVKHGIPVMTGVTESSALAVLQAECDTKRAPLHRLGVDVTYNIREVTADGSVFDVHCMGTDYRGMEIALLGEHQVGNACLAIGAAHLLSGRGVDIPERSIREGLQNARIPGRLEIVQRNPTVILDGAHNPDKAGALRTALDRLFPTLPRVLVLGVGSAKDAKGVLATLAPGAQLVVCADASVLGKPAAAAAALAHQVQALGVPAIVEPDASAAVERALEAVPTDGVVCVTGSLYLVGAVRGRWLPAGAYLERRAGIR